MNQVETIIDFLCEGALNPAKSIETACRETGKEAVGCFPIYTPEELVYAAGFLPVGMWGGNTEIKLADRYLQGFCCSIMCELFTSLLQDSRWIRNVDRLILTENQSAALEGLRRIIRIRKEEKRA